MEDMEDVKGKLSGFFTHGVPITEKISGDEYISDCPFCNKPGHLYININKRAWICHYCNEKGSYIKFLERTSEYNKKYLKKEHIKILAEDRGLPVEAFEGYEMGFDGIRYTFPIRKPDGELIGLRHYRIHNKMMNTKDTPVGLFNIHNVKTKESTVYICEGEFDAIALNWLLKTLNKPGIAIGVPGAGVFSDMWVPYMYGKNVIVLYDNDDAGQKGAVKVHAKLEGTARSLRYIHWKDRLRVGYDVRDLVKKYAVKFNKPVKCYKKIVKNLHGIPFQLISQATKDENGKLVFSSKVRADNALEPITFKELVNIYQKFFHMPDTTAIKVMYGSIYANKIEADMVWMFLVGPPSSLKTELIQSLKMCPEMEMVTTVTPQSFISGYKGADEQSFLKILNNRCLLVKDFTTTLTMPQIQRDAVFGQLRDIYDGEHSKKFGNDLKKFNTKFGIIAGVTNAIEKLGMIQQTLGERFLRYNIPILKGEKDENIGCENVIDRIGKEKVVREELCLAAKRFLGTHTFQLPTFSRKVKDQIIYISRFTAFLRGFVDRDYHGNILYKPGKEGPFRIAKQMAQMALGLAIVENKPEVTLEEVNIVKTIALSTCPSLMEGVVRALYYTNGAPMRSLAIAEMSQMPLSRVRTVLEDMEMLKMVKKQSVANGPSYYTLKGKIHYLAKQGGMYSAKKILI